jgi:hypothetical protein
MFLSPWHRYLQAASGTVTDVFVSPKPTDVSPGVPVVDVGVVTWTPSDARRTLVWQIGEADRTGGEFALAREPRGWFLPGGIFVFFRLLVILELSRLLSAFSRSSYFPTSEVSKIYFGTSSTPFFFLGLCIFCCIRCITVHALFSHQAWFRAT